MWRIDQFTSGPWELHPFYPNIVIADNPETWRHPELNMKKVFVARNANRLPDYNSVRDALNMKRIVSCVNLCYEYANDELNQMSLLRVIRGEPEKQTLYMHSTTPWEIDPYTDHEVLSITRNEYHFKSCEIVVKRDWNYIYDEYITPGNCYRIVACVNFCEGYTNEELDKMNLRSIIGEHETEIY